MPDRPLPARLRRALRERFGHDNLFPLQRRVIERLVDGGDALVVMPTGSGKSLCFQLPAVAAEGPGLCLVLSPLIALMEDQVRGLRARGIRADYVNSTLDRAERERRQARLAAGEYELLYATPERLRKPAFREALARVPGGVRLLAVDEAHCISRWGHDFRPAYGQVGDFRRALGEPVTVALTATATAEVRADIRAVLGLDERAMPLFASGIDRPNLRFEVHDCWDDDAKLERLLAAARAQPGTGIAYFALIRDLDHFRTRLAEVAGDELELVSYHGQLAAGEKRRLHERFMTARPDERLLLLATNAFGMGVDKPDIRFIVHAQVPGSVEAWYQEVGRAGRDGEPSLCSLLWNEDDLAIQQTFVEWMNPSPELLRRAAREAAGWPHGEFHADDLRDALVGRNRGDRRVEACLTQLRELGIIEPGVSPERDVFVRPLEPDEIDDDALADKRRRDLERLLDVVHLVRADDMRRFVLDYFDLDDPADG